MEAKINGEKIKKPRLLAGRQSNATEQRPAVRWRAILSH